ncbi:MAG: hypothetical protein ACC660_05415 [Acidimicrobiales bacterium]
MPIFIRPLTIADVLDGAFHVIMARPRTIITIAAWFVLPVGLLVAYFDVGLLGGDFVTALTDPATFEEGSNSTGGNFGLSILSTLGPSALITHMAAQIARVVEGGYLGRDLTARQAMAGLGWSWVAVVVAFVVVHLLEALGTLLLVLPGLAAMALFMVTTPVLAIERLGPFRAIRRSFHLVRQRFWPTMWIALLAGLVSNTLSIVLPLLPVAVVAQFGLGGEQYVVAVGTIAASLLTLPFVAASAVLAYLDLRVRTEGMDLELAIVEQFEDRA